MVDRLSLSLCVAAGCSFAGPPNTSVEADAAADAAAPDAAPDAPPAGDPAAYCPNDPDLVLCLPFENSGDDHQGHAVTASNLTFSSSGDFDRSGVFSGSTALSIPESADFDNSAITVEAWVKSGHTQTATILENAGQYRLTIDGSSVSCRLDYGATNPSRSAALPDADWHHVACAADPMSFYIDGQRISGTTIVTADLSENGTDGIVVGADNPITDGHFTGELDNVRVWRRNLTQQELCLECPTPFSYTRQP